MAELSEDPRFHDVHGFRLLGPLHATGHVSACMRRVRWVALCLIDHVEILTIFWFCLACEPST